MEDLEKEVLQLDKRSCKEHPDQKLTLYCTEDEIPVCAHCLLIGRHINHKCESLRAKKETAHNLLLEQGVKLTAHQRTVEACYKQSEQQIEQVNSRADKLEKNIREQVGELRKLLDQQENSMLEEVRRVHAEKMKQMQQQRQEIERARRRVQEMEELNRLLVEMPEWYFDFKGVVDRATAHLGNLRTTALEGKLDTAFHLILNTQHQVKALKRLQFEASWDSSTSYHNTSYGWKGEYDEATQAPYFNPMELELEALGSEQLVTPFSGSYLDYSRHRQWMAMMSGQQPQGTPPPVQ